MATMKQVKRRKAALERREKDVLKYTMANDNVKKLECAQTDVTNLYAKLGLAGAK